MIETTKTRSEEFAVVDDDPTIRRVITEWLEAAGHSVQAFVNGRAFIDSRTQFSVVILDLELGDMSGLDILPRLRQADPNVPVIMVTARDNAETVVQAMRHGAYDYLVKPLERARLMTTVERALHHRGMQQNIDRLESQLSDRATPFKQVVGRSPAMGELLRQVQRVLDSEVAVALFGESGTGKELVARAIHGTGRRRAGPFVAINCAAIPEGLQESELFGHERGAFTGAVGVHQGRFEQANGGTLFLDEVGEMSPMTQASLLRTLQERSVRRVGGISEVPVDVRVVCATHRDLEQEVRAGRFREDLYFRLVVYPIRVPPLRDRNEDIPLLVSHFIKKYRADVGREIGAVHPDFFEALNRYPWPGNVRELENVVHRAMLASDDGELRAGQLPMDLRDHSSGSNGRLGAFASDSDEIVPMAELERRAIKRALRATEGSVERAARLLGIGRATLYRRLATYESQKN